MLHNRLLRMLLQPMLGTDTCHNRNIIPAYGFRAYHLVEAKLVDNSIHTDRDNDDMLQEIND